MANKSSSKIKYPWHEYEKIVSWLLEVVGDEDERGFDPTPMFLFAHRYHLLHWDAKDIYREFVNYQCFIYNIAGSLLHADKLNILSFGELQQMYESGELK